MQVCLPFLFHLSLWQSNRNMPHCIKTLLPPSIQFPIYSSCRNISDLTSNNAAINVYYVSSCSLVNGAAAWLFFFSCSFLNFSGSPKNSQTLPVLKLIMTLLLIWKVKPRLVPKYGIWKLEELVDLEMFDAVNMGAWLAATYLAKQWRPTNL